MAGEHPSLYEQSMAWKPTERPNVRLAVPFFGVRDIAASLRFYTEGLGFAVTRQWVPDQRVRWCWLELDDVALMLQEYQPGAAGRQPGTPPGQGISICFMCADAIAVYKAAQAQGLSPSTPFVGNNLWVTSFSDPDGYRLDFESPADVPEGTEYSLASESDQGG